MPIGVQQAAAADLEQLTQTLALAHHDYAWARWAFPDEGRVHLLQQLFTLELQIAFADAPHHAVWTTDDRRCVAIWALHSDRPDDTVATLVELRNRQTSLIGAGGQRLAAADALTRSHHPPQPYWYLGTVGTHPDRRGRGLASAVVGAGLERCDVEARVACLETSSDDNVRLYSTLGFDQTFSTTTADGALPLIVMQREPRNRFEPATAPDPIGVPRTAD